MFGVAMLLTDMPVPRGLRDARAGFYKRGCQEKTLLLSLEARVVL
jgi:hypothetical protein